MRVRPDTSTLKAGVTAAASGLKPLNLKVVTDSATATRGMDTVRAATLRVVAAQERLDVLRASGNASVGKIASAEAGLLSSQGALVRTQGKLTEEAHKTDDALHAGLLRGAKDVLGLRSYMTQLGTTIAGVFVADKIVGFFKDSAKAAGEAQVEQAKLANSIKNNGRLSDGAAEAFNRQGEALVRLTGFVAPVITSGQSMLASFKLNQRQIETLTPLVLDLSRKMGIDVPMAARLVGRAASGAGNGMARMGVVIDKTKYKADAFGSTVDALRTKAGGFADAYGKTVPGQMDRARASFQRLEEELGAKLLPMIGRVAGFTADTLVPGLFKVGGIIRTVASQVASGIATLTRPLRQELSHVFDYFHAAASNFDTGFRGAVERTLSAVARLPRQGGQLLRRFVDYLRAPDATNFDTGIRGAIERVASELARLPGALQQTAEHIGKALLPALRDLETFIRTSLVPSVVSLWHALQPALTDAVVLVGKTLVVVAGVLGGVMLDALRAVGVILRDVVGPALKAVTGFLEHHRVVTQAVVVAVGTFVGIMYAVKLALIAAGVATRAYAAAMLFMRGVLAVVRGSIILFNATLAANPIGLVVVALAALAAGLVYAYKHSETFRAIVQAAFNAVKVVAVDTFNAIKTVAVDVFDWIKGHWQLLLAIMGGPIGLIALVIIRNFSTIKAVGIDMWHVLETAFRGIVNAFLAVASAIVHGAATIFGWVPGVGGKLKAAAAAFDQFRDDVNAALGGIVKHWEVTVAGQLTINGRAAPLNIVGSAVRAGFARGGLVSGPGGPLSDVIPALLSNGEYVMNAAATRRWRPLLDRLNAVGMARGGPVGSAPQNRAAGATYNATIYTDSNPDRVVSKMQTMFRRMELIHL